MEGTRLESPSREHWLGTDHIGTGRAEPLVLGYASGYVVGTDIRPFGHTDSRPLGLVSGYVGGWLDTLIMRGCDILMSFPTFLIYILIITSFGPSAAYRRYRSFAGVYSPHHPHRAQPGPGRAHKGLCKRSPAAWRATALYSAAGNPAQCERADHRRYLHPGRIRDHGDRHSGLPRFGQYRHRHPTGEG